MPPPATIAVEVGNGRGGLPRCSLLTAERVGEAAGSRSSRDGREKNAWERRRPPFCSALRRRHPPYDWHPSTIAIVLPRRTNKEAAVQKLRYHLAERQPPLTPTVAAILRRTSIAHSSHRHPRCSVRQQGTSLELEVRKLLPCESPTIASTRSPCWSCLQPLSLLHTTAEGGKIAVAATNHDHAPMPPPATIAVEVGNGRGGLPRCSLLTAESVGEAAGSRSGRDGREKNAWERRRPPFCSALRRRHPPYDWHPSTIAIVLSRRTNNMAFGSLELGLRFKTKHGP
nr:hypothetical protein Iba_chr13fCG6930 [Ipomoea batatas]